MLVKILVAILVVLLVLALLIVVLALFFRPLIDYLSRPADPKKAKSVGDGLLESTGKTYIAVVAHPDDAEWYAGGTLISLAGRGNRVIVVLGTSGEKGANVDNLGKIREEKQLEAAKIAGYEKVIFLRHPDRGLSEAREFPGEVEKILRQYKPAAVLSFDVEKEGYIYRHPDHEAAGRAALAAARRIPGLRLYLFHSSVPDVIVDFSAAKEKKGRALTTVADYGSRNRQLGLALLRLLFRQRNGEEPFERFGMAVQFSDVGVQYGEVFRRR